MGLSLRVTEAMGVEMPYPLGSAAYVIGITVNGGCSLWFGVVREGFILLSIYSSRTNIFKHTQK